MSETATPATSGALLFLHIREDQVYMPIYINMYA